MAALPDATSKFLDPWWRLNNLYWIQDKAGRVVRFQLNPMQIAFYEQMWLRNSILKARQHGFTTLIDIFSLDQALFTKNLEVGIIAHSKPDAQEIFRKKVLFPYQNLPPALREELSADRSSSQQLIFSNGSSIRVGTSMRSGTIHILHVSEFGKIAAKYPQKAEEIVTGAFEAVPATGMIFVESTAEGNSGRFYDLHQNATGEPDTPLSFKAHFFAWYLNDEYRLDTPLEMTDEERNYFASLDVSLDPQQVAWYVAKWRVLGDNMRREYPTTEEEAWQAALAGSYYSKQMQAAKEGGRICRLPVEEHLPVHTAWDLGIGDSTAIWCFQVFGKEVRVVDYYEASGEGLAHYVNWLKDKGYRYGNHYLPHDAKVRELGSGKSRVDTLHDAGITCEVMPAESVEDGIEQVRQLLPRCYFDKLLTEKGVDALFAYRRIFDQARGVFMTKPLHDWSSHGADAFRVLARAVEVLSHNVVISDNPTIIAPAFDI